jgi:hypothetical protein
LLQLHRDGLTQVAIAQRLGCDQKTVSNWLVRLTDTTDLAKSYLRGHAFRMAENVIRKGKPEVHIKALRGVGVIQGDHDEGIQVIVGLSMADAHINLGKPLSPGESLTPERRSPESLRITGGSDKDGSVNE